MDSAPENNESMFSRIINNSIQGIAFLKILRDDSGAPTDLEYLFVNPVAQMIMAASAEKIIGNTLMGIYPAARYELFPKCVQAILTGVPVDYVYHYTAGEFNHWFRVTVVPMGENMSLTFTNITAQMQLTLSESRNRELMESAPDAVIVINKHSEIILWNQRAEELFGWKREDVIGLLLTDTIIPERFREAHHRGMERYMTTHTASVLNTSLDLSALKKDGTEFSISLTISQVQGLDYTFLAFIRDTSLIKKNEMELLRAKSELERSNAELEQFAYIAAHDLQEPLRTISSYMELAGQAIAGDDIKGAGECVIKAMESSNRMRELIKSLLEYSNIGSRRIFVQIDLNLILQRVIADLREAIRTSGAVIEVSTLPDIMGDADQIYQLFLNLLNNGLKFRSERPPHLEIKLQNTESNNFVISVRDNGIGIEHQCQEKIFRLFQRLHSRDKYPGTGIGLAICKKIVENHSGRLSVESVPGEGSIFHIELAK